MFHVPDHSLLSSRDSNVLDLAQTHNISPIPCNSRTGRAQHEQTHKPFCSIDRALKSSHSEPMCGRSTGRNLDGKGVRVGVRVVSGFGVGIRWYGYMWVSARVRLRVRHNLDGLVSRPEFPTLFLCWGNIFSCESHTTNRSHVYACVITGTKRQT